jgi:MFS family permease
LRLEPSKPFMFSHITKDFFGNKQSFSIGLIFISVGLLFGNWATFIPFVKTKFDLDDAQLGLLLLSLPFGALTMNPVAATLVRKIGMQKTSVYGIGFMLLAFSLLLNAPTVYFQSFFLFLCGCGISITNVGMNTCVGAIEQHYDIKIMSTCHGMFSLGLMFGSICSSLFGGMGLLPGIYMSSVGALLFLVLLFAQKNIFLIKEEIHETIIEKSKFSFPKGSFLLMIVIGLCVNITEGTMADWSAVFMRDVVKTSTYFEGWGMAGYSLFMALGRLIGDKIIPRFGANKILFYGGILSIIGILVVVTLPFTFSAIIGFALVGAGVSCGAPILYASASRVPNMAKGSGLAIMNTFAMGGFLFGPVLIGFISKATTLSIAFGFIATLGIVWVIQSKRVKLF